MGIITKNQNERIQDAQNQDKIALNYENLSQKKLNSLVDTLIDEFLVIYSTTGQTINTSTFINEIESILRKIYRKVNAEFSTIYLEDLVEEKKKAKSEEKKKRIQETIIQRNIAESAIATALITWSQQTAPEQSKYVTNTWQKIINKNVDNQMAENILNNLPTDNETIANQTKTPLKEELKNHNSIIAVQTVQTASENAKHTEVDELNKVLENRRTTEEDIEKTWVTMGDSHVRKEHQAANMQKQPYSSPFVVGGELLLYPKDTSLGASLGNVIGCRCKSIYE